MTTPQLIHPFSSNIQDCEKYTMGLLIPYLVGDIYTITNYIDNLPKGTFSRDNNLYNVYGDCIITHTIVLKKINKELFNNELQLNNNKRL